MDYYGVDEEGPLPDEQLSTVVVEETLGDIEDEVKELFLAHLHNIAPSIYNADIDPHLEFTYVKDESHSSTDEDEQLT